MQAFSSEEWAIFSGICAEGLAAARATDGDFWTTSNQGEKAFSNPSVCQELAISDRVDFPIWEVLPAVAGGEPRPGKLNGGALPRRRYDGTWKSLNAKLDRWRKPNESSGIRPKLRPDHFRSMHGHSGDEYAFMRD